MRQSVLVTVYKDNGGFKSDGLAKHLTCDAIFVNNETLSLISQDIDCQNHADPGQRVPDNYPNSIKTAKYKLPDGFIWIDYDDAIIFRAGCEACCNPNPDGSGSGSGS